MMMHEHRCRGVLQLFDRANEFNCNKVQSLHSCFVLSCTVPAHLQKLVRSLALQKQFLPLAELEPQLWFRPFHGIAYQRMVEAQEEVRQQIFAINTPTLVLA